MLDDLLFTFPPVEPIEIHFTIMKLGFRCSTIDECPIEAFLLKEFTNYKDCSDLTILYLRYTA